MADCDIGIVGLAVMGSNLALNIAEKGFNVAVFNRTYARTQEFLAKNATTFTTTLHGFETIDAFVNALKVPRKVLLLVQAGAATDATIEQLCKVLSKNDVIVDTGNAHFHDQAKRAAHLESIGLRFLGMGISGGEEGARKGPAFFPGGTLSVWEEIRPIIEAAAAKAHDGRPCVTMNGQGGAGSCVKMYHNAGEYAILQIWAEVVNALFDHFGYSSSDKVVEVLQAWKKRTLLDSYMLDITIEVARACEDAGTANLSSPLLYSKVKDAIGSKGTGLWSVVEAFNCGVPVPSLAMAVTARQMSMMKNERAYNATATPLPLPLKTAKSSAVEADAEKNAFVEDLYHAACLSIISSYAQMFQCLRVLDETYKFGIHLPSTIATFRAGCILQGYLLKPMTESFEKNPTLSNLLCAFGEELEHGLPHFRSCVAYISSQTSVAIPVLGASLAYINAMFQEVLPWAQVVQLQRDVFGRHGFERLDKEGKYNHTWPELQ